MVNYKVSVVMPVYNKEEYIEACIKTIVDQTLDGIEIICVDDGSTDKSVQVIQRLQETHPNIALIQQENQGAGPARNAGMAAATGEFIAFMDPDDWYYDESVLQDLYEAAKKHHVNICGGSLAEYYEGEYRTDYPDERKKYVFHKEELVQFSNYQFDFGYHRFIYRRSFLEENAISFPSYRRFQDPPFFVGAMAAAKDFWVLPRISYVYRVAYKQVNWDEEKLSDLAKGLIDVFSISTENNYRSLGKLEIRRLRKSYLGLLFQAMKLKDGCSVDYVAVLDNLIDAITRFDVRKKYDDVTDALTALKQSIPYCGRIESKVSACKDRVAFPKVSIIIPDYNGEEYISSAVYSALNQTESDIEVIVVDDGSTDGSLSIVREIASCDARVRIVTKENGGLSSARNAGLKVATGKYVLFLDCDDYISQDAVQILYEKAMEDDLDQLFFSAASFYEDYASYKQHPNYQAYYEYDSCNVGKVRKGQAFFCSVLSKDDFKPSACLQLVRRSFLVRESIAFYPGILHEDNLYTLQCLACNQRVEAIGDKLYLRRVHDESIMTSERDVRNAFGYYATVIGIAGYIGEKGISISPQFEKELLQFNRKLLREASKWYGQTGKEQLDDCVSAMNERERILFQSFLGCSSELFFERNEKIQKLSSQFAVTKHLQKEVKSLRRSNSWKIGRAVTSPARYLKRLFK